MSNTPFSSRLFAEFSADALDRWLAGQSTPDEAVQFRDYIAAVPGAAQWIADLKQQQLGSGTDFAQDLVTRAAHELVARRTGVFPGETVRELPQGVEASIRRGVSTKSARERRGALRSWPLRASLWMGTLAMIIGGFFILTRRVDQTSLKAEHLYVTRPYQQAIVNLDDGTRVTLAPQTMLRVYRFGGQERTVVLESGEAYFEVAHASGAPFVVHSGVAMTQVLGTAFLVRHEADNKHVHVAVTDGKIRVTTLARTGAGVTLTTGQSGDITDSTAQVSTTDDLAPNTEWAPGHIIFRHTPLATVLQTVSQWYGYQFRYADQTLGTRAVTMVVSTRSSAEVLAAIEQVLLVNLTVYGDTVTLVPRPPKSGNRVPQIRTYDVWSPVREVGR